MVLTNPTSTSPTFTSPTGLPKNEDLVFELVVSDGQFTSVPDAVTVTVQAAQPLNIAPLAAVTASSETPPSLAIKAVDGVIDGYPGDESREWATLGEGVGAWIQLDWTGSYLVDGGAGDE